MDGRDLFREGIELYNLGKFFEAHEVLEEAWRPERGEPRLFLQSLIHFAVGFYHQEQGNGVGAERQLRKALKKLAGYLPEYRGIDTRALYGEGQRCLAVIEAGGRVEGIPKIADSPDLPGDHAGSSGRWR